MVYNFIVYSNMKINLFKVLYLIKLFSELYSGLNTWYLLVLIANTGIIIFFLGTTYFIETSTYLSKIIQYRIIKNVSKVILSCQGRLLLGMKCIKIISFYMIHKQDNIFISISVS